MSATDFMSATASLPRHWLKELPYDKIIDSLCRAALQMGLPLALWRQGGRKIQNLLIDFSGEADRLQPELEVLPPGFLFSPYEADLAMDLKAEQKEKGEAYFLRAHILLSVEDKIAPSLKIASGLSHKESSQAEELMKRAREFAMSDSAVSGEVLPYYTNPAVTASDTDRELYIKLVKRAIQQIEEGSLQKVVCARSKSLAVPEAFHPLSLFQRLCEAYQNAFVSFVSIPGIGSWMGASPETLIRINQQKTFHTMSLAGTQPKAAASSPAEAVWRQKEIEEQALVSRYIINCFKKIRLREFTENGPRTVVAANLMHLRTDFSVDMQETGFPNLGSIMLSLLHPTSAVCGMPRETAKVFLREQEGLDRQFFAGFLGPVNLQEETSLFVNLRCMQLLKEGLMLYAGAGITADSNPEKEWQETEDKCDTLADLLLI